MGLLDDAAVAWHNLHNVRYELLLGRGGKWTAELSLDFRPDDFPHLAGIQYAKDVDFGLRRSEIFGGKFLGKVLSKSFDTSKIEKAQAWFGKIQGRLLGITALETVLDSNFIICQFEQRRVPHNSNIEAKYVIKHPVSGVTFFVFLDHDTQRWFCRSIFQLNVADYTVNQTRVIVLKKRKICDGVVLYDYIHPNYNNTPISTTD